MTLVTGIIWACALLLCAVAGGLIGSVVAARYRARDKRRAEAAVAGAVEEQQLTDRHLRLVAGDVAVRLLDAVEERDEKLVNRHRAATLEIVNSEVPRIVKQALDEHHAERSKP